MLFTAGFEMRIEGIVGSDRSMMLVLFSKNVRCMFVTEMVVYHAPDRRLAGI